MVHSPITRCIFIDDDEDDQIIFEQIMSSYFKYITFSSFTSVQKGLDDLKLNYSFVGQTVVFLDLNMPKQNGFDFLEEKNRNSNLSDLKVIIYSTSNNPADINKCLHLGAEAFITKPSKIEEMVEVLRKYLFNG